MRNASANEGALWGAILNSWKSTVLSACRPPLMTLRQGTGRIAASAPPRCRYKGTPDDAAAARATAIDTPRMALAPSRALFRGAVERDQPLVDALLIGGRRGRSARRRSRRRRARPPAAHPLAAVALPRRPAVRPPRARPSTRPTAPAPRPRSRRRGGCGPPPWDCRASPAPPGRRSALSSCASVSGRVGFRTHPAPSRRSAPAGEPAAPGPPVVAYPVRRRVKHARGRARR